MLDFEFLYGVILFILFISINFNKIKNNTPLDIYILISFYIYIIYVISLVFFPIMLFKPSDIDFKFLDFINFDISLIIENYKINALPVIGNFILLFPLGFYFSILSKSKVIFSILAKGMLVSLSIELIQLIICLIIGVPDRICDINDLISNFAGYLLGYIFYLITLPIIKLIVRKCNINTRGN